MLARWLAWTPPAPGAAYRPQLDGLRAVAVAGVLWAHFCAPDSDLGTLGVRLFFVLSGMLITEQLIGARGGGAAALGRFYIRRVLRLWPAYYLVLGFLLVADAEGFRAVAWWHAGYASNVLFAIRGDYVPWPTAALWSLAVEEQFYVVWPLLVMVLPGRRLMWMALACIPAAIAYRMIVADMGWTVHARLLLPGSIDALGAGAAMAWFSLEGRWPARRWLLLTALCGSALYAGNALSSSPSADWGRSIDLLLFVPLIAVADRDWTVTRPVLCHAALRYLGRISYGIYLWHLPVRYAMGLVPGGWRFHQPGIMMLVAGGLVTIVVASLSWFLVEAPVNRLKKRFVLHGSRSA